MITADASRGNTHDLPLAGAPFALALSARSNVLQEFGGGPGQIAPGVPVTITR